MTNERRTQHLDEAARHRSSRRQIIQRAAALGISAPALAAALSSSTAFAQDVANPLGIDPEATLDILMWKAGWGDEFAVNAREMYAADYPDAEIKYDAVQRVPETVQPRFVAGNPPDAIEATQLDLTSLVSEEQLSDLTDLLAAPSYDIPDATLQETLLPDSQDSVTFNGTPYAVNFTFGLNGLWYSRPLMEEHGWEYPTTWDDMLALCEEIKGSTDIAPWTYQGQYPGYMTAVLMELIWKQGGIEVIANIDNLEPDAWNQPAVQSSVEAIYQLAERDFILSGTAALTHTESQALWLQGEAAFIPCGTWLENEMKDLIPEGFDMVFAPVPAPATDPAVLFEGVSTSTGQPFVVPSQAANVPGGKEYIRLLFSKENARFFSEYSRSLTTIVGAADGLDLGSAFNSARDALNASDGQTFTGPLFPAWYDQFNEEVNVQMGALLTMDITPAEFMTRIQEAADELAQDDSVEKFEREI